MGNEGNGTGLVSNPFGGIADQQQGALAQVASHQAEQEIQAAMVIAQRFPRDPLQCMDAILQDCTRAQLAEIALYAYPKGDQTVTGPSIRLAEVVAQRWGNVWFGVTELERGSKSSTAESYAWDLQTNARDRRVFTVPHIRHTRRGSYTIEDPREIYELIANNGARRKRAAIQAVVPREVFDAAEAQCERTLAQSASVDRESIEKMAHAFAEFGVTNDQLVRYIGHRLDSMIIAEMVRLKKVYASIRDGFAFARDFFGDPPDSGGNGNAIAGDGGSTGADKFREAVARRGGDPSTHGGQAQGQGQQEQGQAPEEPAREQTQTQTQTQTHTETTASSEQGSTTQQGGDASGPALLDINSVPWDSRIHAANKSKINDGSWRRRRGISDEYYRQVLAEITPKAEPETSHAGEPVTGGGEEPPPPEPPPWEEKTQGQGAPATEPDPSGQSDMLGGGDAGHPLHDDGNLLRTIYQQLPGARREGDLETIADLEDLARSIEDPGSREQVEKNLAEARAAVESGAT